MNADRGAHGRLYDAAGYLLWATGLTTLSFETWTRHGRFALLLHGISSQRRSTVARHSQPHLTREDLTDLLEWLRPRFELLSPEEYLGAETPGVLLTFDDGFANNYHNALPVLRAFGCPALFFVTTQHVREPRDWLGFVREQAQQVWGSLDAVPSDIAHDWYDGMSRDELLECCADPLITIGSHGVGHRILVECDDELLERELRDSRSYLESVAGGPIDYFAYPHGDYDARVAAMTQEAGYKAAFTIDPVGKNGGASSPYALARVGLYQADRRYLSLKMSGLHRRPSPVTPAG